MAVLVLLAVFACELSSQTAGSSKGDGVSINSKKCRIAVLLQCTALTRPGPLPGTAPPTGGRGVKPPKGDPPGLGA